MKNFFYTAKIFMEPHKVEIIGEPNQDQMTNNHKIQFISSIPTI